MNQQSRFLLILFTHLFFIFNANAQTVQVRGTIIADQDPPIPLDGVEIRETVNAQISFSDESGSFNFANLKGGSVNFVFVYNKVAVDSMQVTIPSGETSYDLGTIKLYINKVGEVIEEEIPTVVLSQEDFEAEDDDLQFSTLLTASRDPFVASARFIFGPRRFRIRGYDSENNQVHINGVPVNELENGRTSFNYWSGLNDITRNSDLSIGLDPVDYTFGGIGGASVINMKASQQRKQTRIALSSTNGNYNRRILATHSTGMMKNGWAFSVSGSRRWAQEGYVDGTFYDAFAYYGSAEKQFDNHSINLTVFGSSIKRGRSTAAVQELYDITGSNYYNPYWGYQNGEKRNTRVGKTHQPMGILTHEYRISDATTLTTAISYQTGENGGTALNWYNARDPRPNYYRRLPSFIASESSQEIADQVIDVYQNDPDRLQVDWDYLYEINRNSLETVENANGSGEAVTGRMARYFIEDRRYDNRRANIATSLNHQLNETTLLSGGFSFQGQKVISYKEIVDLLGSEFALDLDQFAQRDFPDNPDAAQSDLDRPNRIVREGDVFGYDYDSNIRKYDLWAQTTFELGNTSIFVAADVNRTSFWRTGRFRNGRFPESSLGDSEIQDFTNGGVKAGLTYTINGRNYIYARAGYMTRAPFFRNSYLSVRTRDEVVPGLQSEKIYSGEAAYVFRSPRLKAKASFYYTQFNDQTWVRSFFQDDIQLDEGGLADGFVNFIMTNVDKQHMGTELSAEYSFSQGLTVKAVAAIGQFIFNDRPLATIYRDNDAVALVKNRLVYAKNFYVPGMPQSAYNLGFNYRTKNFWSFYLDFSYMNDLYIDFNPNRRTEAAISFDQIGSDKVEQGSDSWNDIIRQEKVDGYLMVDLSISKSIKFKNGHYLYINGRINNLLNNQNYITGGYEQLRFDFEGKDIDRFASRYFYGYGFGYFVNVTYKM